MDEFPMPVRVTVSRVSDHIDDVRLRAGDSVAVGHRNQQYPEFVWCAGEDGRAGWVPEELLEMTGKTSAVALRDYDASHLTVSRGELLEALEQVGDWARCRNGAGLEGWVRADALEDIGEPRPPEPPKRVRVVRAHITSDPDPVRFVAGDALGVGHHDQQWTSYVWCTDQAGHAGWVPDFYLEMTGEHEATALRDYDSTELTVSKGELLDVEDEAGGWYLCRAGSGLVGWVPSDVVEPV